MMLYHPYLAFLVAVPRPSGENWSVKGRTSASGGPATLWMQGRTHPYRFSESGSRKRPGSYTLETWVYHQIHGYQLRSSLASHSAAVSLHELSAPGISGGRGSVSYSKERST
ncbi:MAG: hypothetical protein ACYTFG_00310 [Planctomycetota bacterium]|jgi:hypothetical protein